MSHHAFVYEADSLAAAAVPETVRTPGLDVEHLERESFSIADARELKTAAWMKPVAGLTRRFVIVTKSLTHEAQNALLKLFEEPAPGVEFHLIVPQVAVLLPTLRSRVMLVQRAAFRLEQTNSDLEEFITLTIGQRLEHIAKITKEKDVEAQEKLLRGIEHYAHAGLPATHSLLREVVLARTYLEGSGASRKMLLESLALSLVPQEH